MDSAGVAEVSLPEIVPRATHRGLVVPTLATLSAPGPRGRRENAQMCADCVLAMLDAGVARPELWTNGWRLRRRNPSAFLAAALQDFVDRHGGREVRRRFALEVVLGTEGHMMSHADEGEFVVSVMTQQAAFARLGDGVAAMDRIHPQLTASVLRAFDQFGFHFRTYDWENAIELRDWARSDHDGDKDGLEDFDRDHAPIELPASFKRKPIARSTLQRWTTRHRSPFARKLAALCVEIDALHRSINGRRGEFHRLHPSAEDGGQQLPVLCVSIQERDQIVAAWDHESQWMYEDEPAPNCCWGTDFSVASIRQVFGHLDLAIRLFAAVARLIDLLPGNSKYVYQGRDLGGAPKITTTNDWQVSGGPRLYRVTGSGNLFGDPGGWADDVEDDGEYDDDELTERIERDAAFGEIA